MSYMNLIIWVDAISHHQLQFLKLTLSYNKDI